MVEVFCHTSGDEGLSDAQTGISKHLEPSCSICGAKVVIAIHCFFCYDLGLATMLGCKQSLARALDWSATATLVHWPLCKYTKARIKDTEITKGCHSPNLLANLLKELETYTYYKPKNIFHVFGILVISWLHRSLNDTWYYVSLYLVTYIKFRYLVIFNVRALSLLINIDIKDY